MNIKITTFGIAKDIVGQKQLDLDLVDGNQIKALKEQLIKLYPSFDKLASLAFAVNEEYKSDDYTLQENDHVVIIPPVSGG